jgi:hypothetical protein
VLLVRSAILRSVFLNRFVMKVVSLPMYVKVVHFCVEVVICSSVVRVVSFGVVCGLGLGGVRGWMWNALLYIMLWMVSSSSRYSSLWVRRVRTFFGGGTKLVALSVVSALQRILSKPGLGYSLVSRYRPYSQFIYHKVNFLNRAFPYT